MKDTSHASVDELAALVLGALDGPARHRVQDHLASGCARCRDDRDWAERVIALGRSDRSVAPPAHVLARALRLFTVERVERPLVPASDTWRRRVRALLVFDSSQMTAAAGVRGPRVARRQVLYSVSELNLEIDMQVQRRAGVGDGVAVQGQVFSGDHEVGSVGGLPIELVTDGGDEATITSSFGEFSFLVPDGAEMLVLRTYDCDIEMPLLKP